MLARADEPVASSVVEATMWLSRCADCRLPIVVNDAGGFVGYRVRAPRGTNAAASVDASGVTVGRSPSTVIDLRRCGRRAWATRQELRIPILTWTERTYHRRRRQAALGRLTPIEYETIMTTLKRPRFSAAPMRVAALG